MWIGPSIVTTFSPGCVGTLPGASWCSFANTPRNGAGQQVLAITIWSCGNTASTAQPPRETLREVLEKNRITVPFDRPDELESRTGSYAVFNDEDVFIIAYYLVGDGQLPIPEKARIDVLDKASGHWDHGEFPESGSVLEIHPTRDRIYLDSNGGVAILNWDLALLANLPGHLLLILPDNTLLYFSSCSHFCATVVHELHVFVEPLDRDLLLYPKPPYGPLRSTFVEVVREAYDAKGEDWFRINNHHMDATRFDSTVWGQVIADEDGNRIAFLSHWGGDERIPTPEKFVVVTCSAIRSATPSCTEDDLAALREFHPGWSDEEILRSLVAP